MRLVDREHVARELCTALELDAAVHAPESDEVLSCAIRRCAAITAPCTRRSIVRAVAGALEVVIDIKHERVDDMLDVLIGHGDLSEIEGLDDEDVGPRIHLAPPAFVVRKSGSVLLLGVAADEVFPLPGAIQRQVEFREHLRLLAEDSAENLPAYLSDFGLLEISLSSWTRAPTRATAQDAVRALDAELVKATNSGAIEGLRILDSRRSVDFYRDRWIDPGRQHTGCFVARRPRPYRAPTWCYVELEGGQPVRFVDLPLAESSGRGCDEAWRLQAAIDACRDVPQKFKRRVHGDTVTFDFFGPMPRWAERRLSAFGQTAPRNRSFRSYELRHKEAEEEVEYLTSELWLKETEENV